MFLRKLYFAAITLTISLSTAIAGQVPVLNNMTFGDFPLSGTLWVILGVSSTIDSPWGDTVSVRGDDVQITIFVAENGAWRPAGYLCAQYTNTGYVPATFSSIMLEAARINNANAAKCSAMKVVYGSIGKEYCIAYAIGRGDDGVGIPIPGQCKPIAPPPVQCNITTEEILLDHKTINELDLAQSKATSNFSVNCNLAAKVKFSLQGGKSTLSIGSGSSTININDKSLLSDIDLKAGENKMTISSTLSGVKPGSWQSSAVLIIEPV